jgi:hypothetical protein
MAVKQRLGTRKGDLKRLFVFRPHEGIGGAVQINFDTLIACLVSVCNLHRHILAYSDILKRSSRGDKPRLVSLI